MLQTVHVILHVSVGGFDHILLKTIMKNGFVKSLIIFTKQIIRRKRV